MFFFFSSRRRQTRFALVTGVQTCALPISRTYEARYVLEGPAAAAPLGATVRLALSTPQVKPAISIPLAALHDAGRGTGIWVLSGDARRVSWRPVIVSALGEETASISADRKSTRLNSSH